MGGFFEWLKRLFGFGDKKDEPKVPDKVEPDVTPIPVPIDPHQPPDEIEILPDEDPGDIVGDPVLARTVDPSASEFKILGHAKLYAPGDTVQFYVSALTTERRPVAGLPAIVTNKAQARRLAGPVTTDAAGEAVLTYVVQDADMSGDMNTPEPDSGSYLCVAYVGGRLLNKVVVLWDVA